VEDAAAVQVVVLDARDGVGPLELGGHSGESAGERPERRDLLRREGRVASDELLEPRWQRGEAQVGYAMVEMVVGVRGLTELELRVPGQHRQPPSERLVAPLDRAAGVERQQPAACLVVRDDLDDPVRPPGRQLRRQPRLEPLDGTAGLEPGAAPVGERDLADAGPRSMTPDIEPAGGRDVGADPGLGLGVLALVQPWRDLDP
jgi:hypothetical protein